MILGIVFFTTQEQFNFFRFKNYFYNLNGKRHEIIIHFKTKKILASLIILINNGLKEFKNDF